MKVGINSNKMNDRIEWVDLASGIMILWLLFFHALYPSIGANITGEIPFLYFFMPWFFFKSGMFFKIKESKLEFKGNFKKLMLDGFIKWSIIGYVAYILEHWLIYDDLTARLAFYSPARSLMLGGCIPLNTALWFLPVLFVIRQSFNYIKQKFAPPHLDVYHNRIRYFRSLSFCKYTIHTWICS